MQCFVTIFSDCDILSILVQLTFKPTIHHSHLLIICIHLSPFFSACLKYFNPSPLHRLLPCSFFFPFPPVNNVFFVSLSPSTAAPNCFILIFLSHTLRPFFNTLITNPMSLGVILSMNYKPSLFFKSVLMSLSE
jgi:hypothetical protein